MKIYFQKNKLSKIIIATLLGIVAISFMNCELNSGNNYIEETDTAIVENRASRYVEHYYIRVIINLSGIILDKCYYKDAITITYANGYTAKMPLYGNSDEETCMYFGHTWADTRYKIVKISVNTKNRNIDDLNYEVNFPGGLNWWGSGTRGDYIIRLNKYAPILINNPNTNYFTFDFWQ